MYSLIHFGHTVFHFYLPSGLSAVGAAFSYHSLDDAASQTLDAGVSIGGYSRQLQAVLHLRGNIDHCPGEDNKF